MPICPNGDQHASSRRHIASTISTSLRSLRSLCHAPIRPTPNSDHNALHRSQATPAPRSCSASDAQSLVPCQCSTRRCTIDPCARANGQSSGEWLWWGVNVGVASCWTLKQKTSPSHHEHIAAHATHQRPNALKLAHPSTQGHLARCGALGRSSAPSSPLLRQSRQSS